MKIKCYNYNKNDGTYIIDTAREFRRIKGSGNFEDISEYEKVVLDDVKLRVKENLISKFEIIED